MSKEKYVDVLGSKMHYVEEGEGDPILFLHGIPTSSYLWRKIIPHLSPLGRCIAPDLIGFGKSDKPDIAYTLEDHIKYIDKFIEVMQLKDVTLVMHAWGSVIGFDYAMRNENNCKGLVFYEALLRTADANEAALPFQEQLITLQDEGALQDFVSSGPSFVDKIMIPMTTINLGPDEMEHYRKPFIEKGASKPVVEYIKELPRFGSQNKVSEVIANYTKKLTRSELPKLMLYSIPGFMTTIATVMWAKQHLPHLEIADVGEELHLAQESNPTLIGETISAWLQSIEQVGVL